ncbi:hypothetical protein RvY_13047-2 [Ramazzottius varieornatus]|uniref:Calcium-transporting ATPase n=1 Tax=Ramazzottius varieornatus TaxID=947166 RepID=A0A1D1VNS9_RAMVA|nr:hypothetical protein RvY_13047-2 [Ramazzottius varieornatus]
MMAGTDKDDTSIEMSGFSVKRENLSALMKLSGSKVKESVEKDFGGVTELCAKLQTSPTAGISGDAQEIRRREAAYGENAIPMKKSKSFLQLVWKALKDPTLLILEAAAVVSIAVALYNIFGTPGEVTSHNSNSTTSSPQNTSVVDEDDNDGDLEWIEGVAICVAVIIVVMVSAVNDYGKERKFRDLQKEVKKEHQVTVIRNGQQTLIPNDELVVGDISVLKYGDVVPADGLLLSGQDLRVDESSLTGESDHVKKNVDDDVRVLSGTNVMEGTGKMLVVAVGLHSQTGIIFSLLGTTGRAKKQSWMSKQLSKFKSKPKAEKDKDTGKRASFSQRTNADVEADRAVSKQVKKDSDDEFCDAEEGDEEQSVLQKKLALIALRIGKIGLAFAVATAAIIIIRFCVQQYVIDKQGWHAKDVENILYGIITGITILVIAIPEGLPLAVTLTLAVSSKKMMKDHNLVRNLFACETMGCATTICSDKTGTLTTNRMTVTEGYVGKKTFAAENLVSKDKVIDRSVLERLAEGIAVNSGYSTNIVPSKDGSLPSQIGNKTECALLGYIQGLGYDYMNIRNRHPEESFVKVHTFNSKRKFMATVLDLKEDNVWRIHCKGAAEIILQKCDGIMEADGTVTELSGESKQEILEDVIPKMASCGLRTICVAYKDVPAGSNNIKDDDDSKSLDGFTCLAIFGIEDPVRQEVPAAIRQCQKAGVIVRMVTGDNVNTARSIATKCGIITEKEGIAENAVLEGEEFNRLIRSPDGHVDQDKFDSLWPNLRVLARSTPQDKHKLVSGIIHSKLSKHRDVVAVTGDGANDAPALKKAHVGFAMGIAGTDVAKEASDIIITDDNFISIVKACMWGRNIYDNICKFLQFQLTVNVAALILAFVAACVTGESPLKPVPMLFINLIQDSLASLALSTEMPTEHLLERKPYGRKANLLSRIMLRNILGQAFFQLAVTFILVFSKN